jgi:hypothetical protein
MITERLRVLLNCLHDESSTMTGVQGSVKICAVQVILAGAACVANAVTSRSALDFDSSRGGESEIVPKDALIGYAYEDKKSL